MMRVSSLVEVVVMVEKKVVKVVNKIKNIPKKTMKCEYGYHATQSQAGEMCQSETGSRLLTSLIAWCINREAIKQQIRFTKQESLSTTRNAIRTAREAEETAQRTLGKLGEQTGVCDDLLFHRQYIS